MQCEWPFLDIGPVRAKYWLKARCKYMFLLTSLANIINWMPSVRIVVDRRYYFSPLTKIKHKNRYFYQYAIVYCVQLIAETETNKSKCVHTYYCNSNNTFFKLYVYMYKKSWLLVSCAFFISHIVINCVIYPSDTNFRTHN